MTAVFLAAPGASITERAGKTSNPSLSAGAAPLVSLSRAKAGFSRRHLLHQLSQHRLGEAVEIARGKDKGAGAADHVVPVIIFEPRLLGQDRQPVDRDPGLDDLSRTACGGAPKLAIPSPEMSISRRAAGCGRWSNCAAAAASAGPIAVSPRELRVVACTAAAKPRGAAAVDDARPTDGDRDLVGVRPFENQGLDPARSGGDRPQQPADRSKARAMPSRCRMYESARHAGGDVDRQHDRQRRPHAPRPRRATIVEAIKKQRQAAHRNAVSTPAGGCDIRSQRCARSLLPAPLRRYKLTSRQIGRDEG